MFSIRPSGRPNSWCRDCMREACRDAQTKRRHAFRNRLEVLIPSEKSCSRCQSTLQASCFGLSKQTPDGLRSYCKPCEVAWAKEKYWRNIEASRKSAMARYFVDVEKSRASGRVNASIRRARISGAGGTHTKADVEKILRLQRCKCSVCGCSVKKLYHVDHIIPLAKGGTSWPWNLQILCPTCNMKKRDSDPIDHARSLGRLF